MPWECRGNCILKLATLMLFGRRWIKVDFPRLQICLRAPADGGDKVVEGDHVTSECVLSVKLK